MLKINVIQDILDDWESDNLCTNDITAKYKIGDSVAYAITWANQGVKLSAQELAILLPKITSDMPYGDVYKIINAK